ncbi:MAG: transcriptional regulator NrdR [Thermomicrobiales bacterium]|nr:transcriptional regulator NrdR [Thermomicrobiales bacterium]MCO5217610.1 transcriptional regulator NrdR [Thermomicrobiales bacterium]MCO5224084.1 transcriptional regulator NrdR [Thermomicrobiales bacterium]MCO5226919.1 transcriptional regulator NrdR [Thermomicrobiales bacterium]
MRCPFCRADNTRVIDSRDINTGEAIRRRRECEQCHSRFTTYERYESVQMMVVKKDGRREEFNPAKLRNSLRISLTKRPVSEDQLDELIDAIEARVLALGQKEVGSSVIGEITLTELRKVDEVAYIRFASVYREFRDADEFAQELQALQS